MWWINLIVVGTGLFVGLEGGLDCWAGRVCRVGGLFDHACRLWLTPLSPAVAHVRNQGDATPAPYTGTIREVEWTYKLRPFRDVWIRLLKAALVMRVPWRTISVTCCVSRAQGR